MLTVLALLVLLVLPSVIGIVHDRRIDRQIREAQEARKEYEDRYGTQKSSSRSTVPSTATWYADGRRSKKLVSS
jgi:type II secretory pathway pseudopilin PulG